MVVKNFCGGEGSVEWWEGGWNVQSKEFYLKSGGRLNLGVMDSGIFFFLSHNEDLIILKYNIIITIVIGDLVLIVDTYNL